MVFKPHEIKPFLALALRLQHEGGLTTQEAVQRAIAIWRAQRTNDHPVAGRRG